MMVNVGSIFLLAHLGIPEMKKRRRRSIIGPRHPFKGTPASAALSRMPRPRARS